jgi:hypothetical protein
MHDWGRRIVSVRSSISKTSANRHKTSDVRLGEGIRPYEKYVWMQVHVRGRVGQNGITYDGLKRERERTGNFQEE